MGEGGCFHLTWGQEAGRFRSGEPMATVAMGLSQIQRRPWCGASHLFPRHRAPQRCLDARAGGLACLPRAPKKARLGLRAGVADLQGHQRRRSRAWARLGKKLGLRSKGTCPAMLRQRGRSQQARSGERAGRDEGPGQAWQRRLGTGTWGRKAHGHPRAGPAGRRRGKVGGTMAVPGGDQMVPEQLWARKMVR